jgi:MOSC domain-containing protein YiiM
MRLISLNIGRARHVEWYTEDITTAIFKTPVNTPLHVHTLGISGDEQADLTIHGGARKAVYAYASERYRYWREQLPDTLFPWGAFGENLTLEGLTEDQVYAGDRLAIGSAEFVVTQPRMPCFKLGIRFDRFDMAKRFLASGFSGFYLAVTREGTIQAGDAVTLTPGDRSGDSIANLFKAKSA